jgi:FtsH-binding integral membrane protein
MYFLAFKNGKPNRILLIVWNLIALGLLVNIVTIAFLSFKSPLQRLALDQPNVAVTYFPFIWLPAVIVPLVLFCHLAALWQLLRPETRHDRT